MTSLATRIKKKLDEKGISAYKLEKQVGLKRSAINNILYGKSKSPGIDIIQSIAKGLNCSVSELVGESITSWGLTQAAHQGTLMRSAQVIPENMPLYLSTLEIITSILKEKHFSLTREEIFNCVEETYNYSLKAQKETADLQFADWILAKFDLLYKGR